MVGVGSKQPISKPEGTRSVELLLNNTFPVSSNNQSDQAIDADPVVVTGVVWTKGAVACALTLKNGAAGGQVFKIENTQSGAVMGLNVLCDLGLYYDTAAAGNPDYTIYYQGGE